VRPAAREQGKSLPQEVYGVFVERCRANLHLVLCMSPIGDAFRNRLRMFPALVNCCTIDWFTDWPEDALTSVARHYLDDVDMDATIKEGVVETAVTMHSSVQELAARYKSELRRHFYVTPTSYLELINTIKGLLAEKRQQIQKSRKRYLVGLERLDSTAQQVAQMQDKLNALKPQLIISSKETDELMKTLQVKQSQAAEAKQVVEKEELEAQKNADKAKAMKDECQSNLAQALPALQKAVAALKALDKGSIAEVRAMKKPPDGVKLVMAAVCVLLGEKPVKTSGPKGEVIWDYWKPATKLLGDLHFLQMLYDYDKDNIPDQIIKDVCD